MQRSRGKCYRVFSGALVLLFNYKVFMTFTKQQFKQFYDKVGSEIGWDFSKVKYISEGVEWDFYDEVIKKSKKTDILLDIGTGGGEKILEIAKNFKSITAIDNSQVMIETANKNLSKSGLNNVNFTLMDADNISFPDNTFNIISCRHSVFNPFEVYRLLLKN